MNEPPGLGDTSPYFGGLLFVAGALFFVWAWHKLGLARLNQISWEAQISGIKSAALVGLAGVTILIVTIWIARGLRPRSATVFVSYPNEQLTVASALANVLKTRRLEARIVPFVDRPEDHDAVISEVVSHIQAADVLVAITAATSTKPSMGHRFYEAEIFAATVARKPVILLAREQEFRLPPTAYEGYPVLSISSLETRNWEPLATIIQLAVGTKATVSQGLAVAAEESVLVGFAISITAIVLGPLLGVLTILAVAVVAWLRGLERAVWIAAALKNASFALMLGALSVSLFVILLSQLHKQLRLRQKFRDDFARRNMTNNGLATLLQKLGGGDVIIACLLESANSNPTPGEAAES